MAALSCQKSPFYPLQACQSLLSASPMFAALLLAGPQAVSTVAAMLFQSPPY